MIYLRAAYDLDFIKNMHTSHSPIDPNAFDSSLSFILNLKLSVRVISLVQVIILARESGLKLELSDIPVESLVPEPLKVNSILWTTFQSFNLTDKVQF